MIGALIAWLIAGAAVRADELALALRAGGFDRPSAIATPPDGSGRIFVAEKHGLLRIVDGGTVLATPFLDLTAIVLDQEFERGLAGLAFHPDYATNGAFFVAYTAASGDSVVARYHVSADPDVADAGSAEPLLVVEQPSSIHNVNQLAFGPEGALYVASGDGGPNDATGGANARRLDLLLGKLLRIDVDSATPPLAYSIPSDNPFLGVPDARAEIWATGLRNPSRFSFDRATGDLWIADVGFHLWEEIDLEPAGDPGGRDYGWNVTEGGHCGPDFPGCSTAAFTPPVLEYPHGDGNCAVIGGFRYRGTALPGLVGTYLFADWCSGRVWGATPHCGGAWGTELLVDAPFQVAAFGENQSGELVLASYESGTAAIYDLVPGAPGPLFADGFESADGSAWSDCAPVP